MLDSLIKGMELSLMLLHIGMELVASGACIPVVLVALVPAVGGSGSTIGSAFSATTTASAEASSAFSVGVPSGHLVVWFSLLVLLLGLFFGLLCLGTVRDNCCCLLPFQ